MPNIYLYAEILTNIRQLTLHASLQAEKHEGAKLEVTTDKTVVSVTHGGETQRLYLPTQIKGDATVTFPLLKKTEISARVQIDDEHEWRCRINNEVEAPWMAADLSSASVIRCKHCKSNILSPGTVQTWKNLPSDNWAELMDFWFCHKPHDENKPADEAAAAKGFASSSKLSVSPGIGMTDLISLVVSEDDCHNIKAAERHSQPVLTVLRCKVCYHMLGTTNEEEKLIRLHKSQLSISIHTAFRSYPSTIFTCAQILSLIEATALKRFVLHGPILEEQPSSAPLILWVFNPDIYYSCSAPAGNGTFDHSATNLLDEEAGVVTAEADLANSSGGLDRLPIRERPMRPTSVADDDAQCLSANSHSGIEPSAHTPVEYINLVHRAAKIFYKDLPHGITASDFLNHAKNASSHEELYLSDPSDVTALREALVESNSKLPASARTLQDWNVGLLDRYETTPSGLGVMAQNPLARGIKARDGRVTRWDLGYGADGLYS